MKNIVESKRIQYTASHFAKESLVYLQEVGISKAIQNHTSSRNKMNSFLFFIVLEGTGTVSYENNTYNLKKDDCFFANCHSSYSHTSDNWTIAWVHFNGDNVQDIYNKYIERNGKNVFIVKNPQVYLGIIQDIYNIANSNDYIKDMNIYNKLINILSLIMSQTIYDDTKRKNKYSLTTIKEYIDNNYQNKIQLDELSNVFFINKFYLTRLFKENYGVTIQNYILDKRITKAKELLRFSDYNIERIAEECGVGDANYFSRVFKKVEGLTPKEYKKMW